MDIKVNQVNQTQQVTQTQHVQESDGSFKFMLASNIEEAELAGKLSALMEQIDAEGKKLAKYPQESSNTNHRADNPRKDERRTTNGANAHRKPQRNGIYPPSPACE